MPKIKFENGVVVNVEGNPTQADIEEIASQMGIKKAETPGGVSGAFKRGWSGLKEDLNKRTEKVGEAIGAQQSGASKALQVAGQGFGTIGDVIGAGITTAASALTPDEPEQAIKTKFTEGVKKIMETQTAKGMMEKYYKFKEENPELAGNIEAVGNIADALLNATGVGAGVKGAEIAGKGAIRAGVKGVEELASAGSKATSFSKRVGEITSKVRAQAKEKFADTKIGEKVSDLVSPLDNNTRKTIDPLASIPEERIPGISKEVIDKSKEATSGKLEYYLNKARRATQNPSLPTPLEFAGKKAEEALDAIGKKIAKNGALKRAETEALKDKVITGVGEIKTKLMDSLGEIAGVELDEAGEFVAKAGRTLAISDKADLQLVKNINSKLASLGDSPSFKQVDDAVDYLQDLLYKKKANLAQPINSKIEGMVKKITGELNGKLRQAGSKLYRESNQTISRMLDVRDNLNKALGRDANKGGSLMKRVFSPTDGGTKELFKEIKRITGIDLNEEATLAKFAMEQLGDARQANLLEQLELIKDSMGAGKGSFLTEAIKNITKKAGESVVGDKVDRARRILKKDTPKIKLDKLIDVEGDAISETIKKIPEGEKSMTKGAIDVVKTEDGYMVLDGQHRASEALQSGKKEINANVLSKEEALKKYGDRWPEIEYIL
ncbi:MAG: hypothetical protein RBT65_16945 [Methanolobus sp.]|nr:hypothetical protein [Methanolobus sp.]